MTDYVLNNLEQLAEIVGVIYVELLSVYSL